MARELSRRSFLVGASSALLLSPLQKDQPERFILTVSGPVPIAQLGVILPHEHVLVDFVGADKIKPGRYDRGEAFRVIRPHLEAVKRRGCTALCECTPNYLGRDVRLLTELARATGLHLVTNTGLYGAAGDRYVPSFAYEKSSEQLAQMWIREFKDGIDGTPVRPGFIKIGVDRGRLNAIDRKLVEAAAITHLETGLVIAAHTGDGVAALEQMKVLEGLGVAPEAWIWVHAQNENDHGIHLELARRGAWIEFDGLSERTLERHVELVEKLRAAGLLRRVLISHDAGWYHVGEPGGGRFRPYTTLFDRFIPELKQRGWAAEEIQRLTEANPAEAFAVRLRNGR